LFFAHQQFKLNEKCSICIKFLINQKSVTDLKTINSTERKSFTLKFFNAFLS
jgi:hypothetical protein